MPHFLQSLTVHLEQLGFSAYWLVALIVYLETLIGIGQFLPGALFLGFVGFLCYIQIFDFSTMLVMVFASHYIGELTNYYLGRTKGRAMFKPENRYLKTSLLEAAERRFHAGAGRLIFVSQFTGFFRSLVPIVAGATHYPLGRFMGIMAIGAFAWSIFHLGLGFIFGASWQQAVHHIERLSLFILVAIPIVLFSGWLIRQIAYHAGDTRRLAEKVRGVIERSHRYQRLAQRHPRTFAFFEARLSLSRVWGLQATVGWIVSAALLTCFCMILFDIETADRWKLFDLSVVNLLVQMRGKDADRLFMFFTNLGSAPQVMLITLLSGALCLRARQVKTFVIIAGSVMLTMLASQLIKIVYARARPDVAIHLVHATGYSFPSGHASVSVALFGALYYWLWNHPGRIRLRMTLAFLVFVIVLMIGFSRMYLGVHFPSDVLAGFCLGLASVITVATIATNLSGLEDVQRPADLPALGVFACALLFSGLELTQNPIAPKQTLSEDPRAERIETTSTLIAKTPKQARSLTGNPVIPTNLVIPGDLGRVRQRLEALGWERVSPRAFLSHQIAAPVFPAFVEGVPPEITMQRRVLNHRFVLRIWGTHLIFEDRPVRVGSIAEEERKPHRFGLRVFEPLPDIDMVAERFAGDLGGFQIATISDFRNRGLYFWKFPFFTHGNALLISPGE